MILAALLAGLLLGLLLGGRLRYMAALPLRATGVILAAVIIRYGSQWLFDKGYHWVGAADAWLYGASLLCVLWFVWQNRKLPSFWLVGMGVSLNALVIFANGGQMPVAAHALRAASLADYIERLQEGTVFAYRLMDETTRLPWLGDRLPLPLPYLSPEVLSVGDLALAAGLFAFALLALQPPFYRRRQAPSPDNSSLDSTI
jgi:hypothetical protein